jgi:hypothetical protein
MRRWVWIKNTKEAPVSPNSVPVVASTQSSYRALPKSVGTRKKRATHATNTTHMVNLRTHLANDTKKPGILTLFLLSWAPLEWRRGSWAECDSSTAMATRNQQEPAVVLGLGVRIKSSCWTCGHFPSLSYRFTSPVFQTPHLIPPHLQISSIIYYTGLSRKLSDFLCALL